LRVRDFKRDFSDKEYSNMVDELNSFMQNGLTLADNVSGQIIENIILPADGTEIKVSHSLKAVPKYRIILRQKGSGVVIDGGEWTNNFVTLSAKNTEINNVQFPGGTYSLDLIAETVTIPATNCTITYGNVGDTVISILLLGG